MRTPSSTKPAPSPPPPPSRRVIDMRVDATSYADATRRVLDWAADRSHRYVCIANVHMTMEAHDDPTFRAIVDGADLVTPDGMPLVWTLRRLGVADATRVAGPDLLLHVCRAAAERGVPVGFHGGSQAAIDGLLAHLRASMPSLRVPYAVSPPFRTPTAEEDDATVAAIVGAGVGVLFVGLGCPKQERWMAAHRDRLPLVQIGVGAAFDFHAGLVRRAPVALQRAGLEWAYRLVSEPRRLFVRYARHNPRFVLLVAAQLWRARRTGR